MTDLYKYRVYCSTEAKYEYTWSETEPTVCPTNVGHTIDSNKTSIIEAILGKTPSQLDGKPYFTPDLFPSGDLSVHTSIFDDITNGTIWGGSNMSVNDSTANNDTVVSGQFLHPVRLAGGAVSVIGGLNTDWVKYRIYGPATAGASSPGTGAFNKVEIAPSSGMYIYVPAPLTDGGWNINLTEKLNANVNFTKAVPIPNSSKTGWFDYDIDTDSLSVNTGQTGSYDLYDFDVSIAYHIPKLILLGSWYRDLTQPAVKPATILPQWKHEVTVHHGPGTHQLDVSWSVYMGRAITV